MQFDRLRKSALARPAALLALAVFAPLAIYAALNAWLALDRRHAALTAESIQGVQAIVETVDRQIATSLEDAETLAGAPALDQARDGATDLKVFEEVARRTRERHRDWLTVILLGPDGRWLFSTSSNGGDATRRKVEDPASFQDAVRTGRPVVGDVVKGAHGRWGIPLRAPVVRRGKVLYVVTVVLDPGSVRQTLSSLRMTGPWITLVVDAQGRIVARLPDDGGRSLGVRLNAQAAAARARGGGGGYRGQSLDHVPTQSFYWVSPTSRWSVHAAIPRSDWEAPLRQMLITMLIGFLVCLLLAAILAVLSLRDHDSRSRQSAAVELATRIDALGRLTGGVAHDFNNLLTVISGNAEILRRRVQGQAQAERPLAAIRTAADRAAALTRQLLVFARGGPAEAVQVDLARKVLDVLGALSQLVGADIVIDTDLEPDLPPVKVDPLQLEAALLNLAANARDAMGGTGMLHLKLRRLGDMVALSMRDQGPGFDPAVLSRVFDPFFTTKPVGQGTGLGLSQVYGLVKGAGGQVEAANAPGGGAVVTLIFPKADEEPTVEAASTEAEPAAGPVGGGFARAILLVDDNDAVRVTAAAYLREFGLAVLEASDSASALDLLATQRVEALVTDIVMPGEMDGMALAEAARAARPDLPVLLVSGYSERASQAQARGFAVISKPYSLPELERRLRVLTESPAAAQV